jgi:hypothetical protein
MTTATLADLKPLADNPRQHTARGLGTIEEAVRRVGAARSGVIDEDNVLLAGNGTAEALAAAGIEKIQIVDAPGDTWVVVRRSGLTPEQKRILAYADNRAGELGGWIAEQVVADLAAGVNLAQAGVFTEGEAAAFITEAERAAREAYDFLEQPETPRTRGQATDQEVEPDPATAPQRGQAGSSARFPLAIVLTRDEHARWQQLKTQLDRADDKAAFLDILAAMEA